MEPRAGMAPQMLVVLCSGCVQPGARGKHWQTILRDHSPRSPVLPQGPGGAGSSLASVPQAATRGRRGDPSAPGPSAPNGPEAPGSLGGRAGPFVDPKVPLTLPLTPGPCPQRGASRWLVGPSAQKGCDVPRGGNTGWMSLFCGVNCSAAGPHVNESTIQRTKLSLNRNTRVR